MPDIARSLTMRSLLLLLAFTVASRPVVDQRLQNELLKFGEAQLNAGKTPMVEAMKAQLDRGNVAGMVATTNSVDYDQADGQQKNLQMVFKTCVSSRSNLALIEPKPAK